MPKRIHGKPVNEKVWAKAVSEAEKSYDKEKEPAKFYATVMTIYNAMIGKESE